MADDLDEIRQEKIESLKETADDTESDTESPATPVHVDGSAHLQELVGTSGVVLVDFYADWCGPCKMLEPIVEDIAADAPATVAKVDVDEHQDLAAEYGVRGVPTIVLYSDGEVVEQFSGVRGEDDLRGLIQQYA
ncbi:MAG: thioredoxin [Salinirussus sp.]